jgi:predicted nucleotidyltransferase component of viral defense system
MTRDEIIELAKQAGMIQDGEVWFSHSYKNCDVYTVELLFFAKLVAEKEREACANAIRARGSV